MQRRLTTFALCAAWALFSSVHGPATAQGKPVAAQTAASEPIADQPKQAHQLVDINSASLAELKTLPGIGDTEARRIVKARPYPSKAKLVADKVLTPEAYQALKGRIVAIQPQPPRTKAESKATGKP